jgi:glycosyltransferase involved in cell wall biosynthesis
VVLLQDPAHPISQYQIPAKVSDGSALGLPILVTDVPPLRDLALQGLVTAIEPTQLATHLTRLLAEREAGAGSRAGVRQAFEAELGLRVNRERLALAIGTARAAPSTLPPAYARAVAIADAAWQQLRARRHSAAPSAPPARVPARARPPRDMVMFWKQNDSGLYGRRADQLMREFLASGRVGRILQFDAPVEVTQLAASSAAQPGSPGSLILRHTLDHQWHLRDTARHRLRTYLYSRRGRAVAQPPVHPGIDGYPRFVEAEMRAWGMRPEDTVAWVCPVVFDFPAVARQVPFGLIVGDLIDDQRRFEMSPVYRERIVASYEATLPLLDHAFTNCQPQVEAFGPMTRAITLVPNGADLTATADAAAGDVPPQLAGLAGPVAGYVGNLRDRFDWGLMREVAGAMPHVTFAIVGGGARDRDILRLADLGNVVFTGVVPADRVAACIRRFDVALVPHTLDDLTATMNPLKIYTYFAARRPIVSTDLGNVDDRLRPWIRFARDAGGFRDAIADALAAGLRTDPAYEAALRSISWRNRARAILNRLDQLAADR